MSCKLVRNQKTIEAVYAPNGSDSQLYIGLAAYVSAHDIDTIIERVPYLQDRLDDKSLLKKSVPEIAAGLWSIAYTPEYQQYLATLNPKLSLDANGEPLVGVFVNSLLEIPEYTKPQLFSKDQLEYINRVKGKANAVQSAVIDRYLEPEFIFDESNHKYYDLDGVEYEGVTSATNGKFVSGKNQHYLDGGKALDTIVRNIVDNKGYDSIKHLDLPEDLKSHLWVQLSTQVNKWLAGGNVIMSQVIVGDKQSGRVSAIDILLIRPDGSQKIIDIKTSKNAIDSDAFITDTWPAPESSAFPGVKFTTKAKYGVQVGVYRKFLELMGFDTPEVGLFVIKTDWKNTTLLSAVVDENNVINYQPGDMRDYVDQIVPTEVPKPYMTQQIKEELGNDYSTEPVEQDEIIDPQEAFFPVVENVISRLELRRKLLEQFQNPNIDNPDAETVNNLSGLIALIRAAASRKDYMDAYYEFVKFSNRQLSGIIHYVQDPESLKDPAFFAKLQRADDFIENYRGSLGPKNAGTTELKNSVSLLQDKLDEARSLITIQKQNALMGIMEDVYGGQLTQEQLKAAAEKDITRLSYYAGDMSQSENPMLSTVDKLFKDAEQRGRMNADAVQNSIANELAPHLQTLGIKDLSKAPEILEAMTDGQGNWVDRMGEKYLDKKREVSELTKNEYGDRLQYIENPQSAKDIQFNIDLWYKKQKQREFYQAETTDTAGFVDGEYHAYKQEFKAVRDKFEQLSPIYGPGSVVVGYEWVRKDGVSANDHAHYVEQYYDRLDYIGLEFADGEPTGRTVKKTGWFVKSEWVEPRSITSKGVDMRNPRWEKLQNPQTEKEKAIAGIYNILYTAQLAAMNAMPPNILRTMEGKLPRVGAVNKGTFIKQAKDGLQNFTTLRVHSNNRQVDENGNLISAIPIYYVGDVRNNKKVEKYQKQIKELKKMQLTTGTKLPTKEYKEKLNKLMAALAIEKGRISLEEMESDPIRSVITFAKEAEFYKERSKILPKLQTIGDQIKSTKIVSRKGEVMTDGNSLASRRFQKWLLQIFYQDNPSSLTTEGRVAEKLQKFTSFMGLNWNLFGAFNNHLTAQLNNSIEALGAKFFSPRNYTRAVGLYHSDYLPGRVKRIGQDLYGVHKAASKFEAVTRQFDMITLSTKDSGKVDFIGAGYALYEGGEIQAQSETGIAYLMEQQVKHKTTGETSSVYDALTFDPQSGESYMDEQWEFSEKDLLHHIDTIKNFNKQIHGNYSEKDRVVLQSHWLGALGLQFKKHVYTSFRNRFGDHYIDRTLGETEGRYRTIWAMVTKLKELEGTLGDRWNQTMAELSPNEIANLRKSLADLGIMLTLTALFIVLQGIEDGLDDDDEMMKRFLNFLQYQDSRLFTELIVYIPVAGTQEQWQMIGHPLPVLGTLKNFGEALTATVKYPFLGDEKRIIQRGPHRDNLRVWKEWQDMTPMLNNLNRWRSFESVQSFYIK